MTADDWDADWDDAEDDEAPIVCPSCGRSIDHDSDQCPHCRQYVLDADLPSSSSRWWTLLCQVIVVLLLIVFLGPAIAMLLMLLG